MSLEPDTFSHRPVMADEVVAEMAHVPAATVVDVTVGGGGHAALILGSRPDLRLLGIDQDSAAIAAAGARLAAFGDRVEIVRGRFDDLIGLARSVGLLPGQAAAVLMDLGVSSHQLDRGERGFSYRTDAALDMRMDDRGTVTAGDIVNSASEEELAALFVENGERRFARRIARALIAARPVLTTGQLSDLVRDAIPAPARRTGGHPAKRVFQALRIAVNDELAVLERALPQALELLAPGGRLVVLAYHSGEDRLVKAFLRDAATGGCTCPTGLPCVCGAVPTARLVRQGARKPTPAEVADNPRAESARLRSAVKLDTGGTP